jgi:hypothetical protein
VVFCYTATLIAQKTHPSIPVPSIILFYFPNDDPRGLAMRGRGASWICCGDNQIIALELLTKEGPRGDKASRVDREGPAGRQQDDTAISADCEGLSLAVCVPKRPLPPSLPPSQVAYSMRKQQTTEMRVSVKPHSHCRQWRGGRNRRPIC